MILGLNYNKIKEKELLKFKRVDTGIIPKRLGRI